MRLFRIVDKKNGCRQALNHMTYRLPMTLDLQNFLLFKYNVFLMDIDQLFIGLAPFSRCGCSGGGFPKQLPGSDQVPVCAVSVAVMVLSRSRAVEEQSFSG